MRISLIDKLPYTICIHEREMQSRDTIRIRLIVHVVTNGLKSERVYIKPERVMRDDSVDSGARKSH
jgi:hypothetical protein